MSTYFRTIEPSPCLEPTNLKGNIILDEIKIASAYGKDNVQNLINNSNILYVDKNKKRINNWLTHNRLQLPLGQNNYQFSNDIVSQKNTDVNSNYIQNTENDSRTAEKTEMQLAYEKALAKSGNNEQYSFVFRLEPFRMQAEKPSFLQMGNYFLCFAYY